MLWGISSHFYPKELLEDGRRNKKKGKRKERERLRVGKKKKEKKEKLFLRRLFGWEGVGRRRRDGRGLRKWQRNAHAGGLIPELLHTVRLNARKRASAARRCIIRQRASSRTAHLSPTLTISGEKKKRSCEKLASFCITYL